MIQKSSREQGKSTVPVEQQAQQALMTAQQCLLNLGFTEQAFHAGRLLRETRELVDRQQTKQRLGY